MEIPSSDWIYYYRRRRHVKTGENGLENCHVNDLPRLSNQMKAWEQLKKKMCFYIAILNRNNVSLIRQKLLKINIVRGKGLLCQLIMDAQLKFLHFTDIYADLISHINPDFPNIGELLLTRCIVQFKRAYDNNDKSIYAASITFIAHLVKRNIACGILALQLMELFIKSLTEHSILLICNILDICGKRLLRKQKKNIKLHQIYFEMLSYIVKNKVNEKIHDMVYKLYVKLRNKFINEETIDDYVLQHKQVTHLLTLSSATDPQDDLNFFSIDLDYEDNDTIYFYDVYQKIVKNDDNYNYKSCNSDSDTDNKEERLGEICKIESPLFNNKLIRKTINKLVEPSLNREKCVCELTKISMINGQEKEFCETFVDYFCDERNTFKDNYGHVAQIFCNKINLFRHHIEHIFIDSYTISQTVNSNRLQNLAKMFAQLLSTNSISWNVLSVIHLNENETSFTSLSFIKILFRELIRHMGYDDLSLHVQDPSLNEAFTEIFSGNNPTFITDFFISLGLDGLIDEFQNSISVQSNGSFSV